MPIKRKLSLIIFDWLFTVTCTDHRHHEQQTPSRIETKESKLNEKMPFHFMPLIIIILWRQKAKKMNRVVWVTSIHFYIPLLFVLVVWVCDDWNECARFHVYETFSINLCVWRATKNSIEWVSSIHLHTNSWNNTAK